MLIQLEAAEGKIDEEARAKLAELKAVLARGDGSNAAGPAPAPMDDLALAEHIDR
jgi:hypothetical protein